MMDFPFELKALSEAGTFEGLAAVYGNVDAVGDKIEPGAFARSLQQRGREIPILWSHDPANPVGLGELTDTPAGLKIVGTLDLDVLAGREAYSRLKKRIVRGLSIGFRTVADKIIDGVRHLTELELFEVSLTALPANELARVTAVKGSINTLRDFERFLHEAGFSRREAAVIATHGYKALSTAEPEEDTGAAELLAWLSSQTGR
jgi:uncharacterized protein